MPLMTVVLYLIIIGVLLYVVNQLIPIDGTIKRLINILVIVVVCLWLLSLFIPFSGGPWVGRPIR